MRWLNELITAERTQPGQQLAPTQASTTQASTTQASNTQFSNTYPTTHTQE